MTGRRLYDLVVDAWAAQTDWARGAEAVTTLSKTPRAWPFLTAAERAMFNHAAARRKGVKR